MVIGIAVGVSVGTILLIAGIVITLLVYRRRRMARSVRRTVGAVDLAITAVDERGGSAILGVGVSCDQNPKYRPSMEDEHVVEQAFNGSASMAFLGVYDGHGGSTTAKYVKDQLHQKFGQLLKAKRSEEPISQVLRQAFLQTDGDLLKLFPKDSSGCTAAIAFVTHTKTGYSLFTANCGDARIVLNHGGSALAKTKDHKTSDAQEIARVDKEGGAMIGGKLGGTLAVARAFGDGELKNFGLTADPYQQETTLQSLDTHLIIACDGLWDVCTNQQAVDLINGDHDAQSCSAKLLKFALEHGSRDNVSIVVATLQI